jgi:hypothetical protein
MFNETSYTLGDTAKDYAAICAAHPNRPACLARAGGGGLVSTGGGAVGIPGPDRQPGTPIPDMGTGGSATGGGLTTGTDSSSGGGLSSFFSSIPTSYLLIGAAIIAVMVLKK